MKSGKTCKHVTKGGRTRLTPRDNVGRKWIYRFALFEDAFQRWDMYPMPALRSGMGLTMFAPLRGRRSSIAGTYTP